MEKEGWVRITNRRMANQEGRAVFQGYLQMPIFILSTTNQPVVIVRLEYSGADLVPPIKWGSRRVFSTSFLFSIDYFPRFYPIYTQFYMDELQILGRLSIIRGLHKWYDV